MKIIVGIIIVIVTVSGIGCKSAQKIQAAINKKDTAQTVLIDNSHADSLKFIHSVLDKINDNRIRDFRTFSAKIKVNYTDKEGEQPELTVFLRMQKDSMIWLSVNATIFSYEAMRILITPDSVKMLNYKDKILTLRSVSYLQELTQLPFDFSTLQDLLVGNPIYLDTNVVSYKKINESVLLMNIGQFFKNLVTVTTGDYLMQHSKLDDIDPIRNRTCDLTYSGYVYNSGVKFATERRITVSERAKLDVDMNFKQFGFNETLSYPFSVPKKFKRQ